MLRIEQNGPKEWSVVVEDHEPIKLFLSPSSVTNKYFIVTKFIERVAEHNGEGFSDWFMKFLTDCQNETLRSKAVIDSIPQIKTYVDSFLDGLLNSDESLPTTQSNAPPEVGTYAQNTGLWHLWRHEHEDRAGRLGGCDRSRTHRIHDRSDGQELRRQQDLVHRNSRLPARS